jgi:hypothetical protein
LPLSQQAFAPLHTAPALEQQVWVKLVPQLTPLAQHTPPALQLVPSGQQ